MNGGYMSGIVTHNGESRHVSYFTKNLLTNNGRDWMHAQVYTDTAAAAAGDTALAQELTGGGMSRADATTKTHSNGTNSSTIEHTFTASATYTNVHKSATFNAATGVTLGHEAVFSADATLVSGDTLKVTWTMNLG